MNWQSGFPLNIVSGEDTSLTTIGNDQADVVSKPSLTSGSQADRVRTWFTTESFKVARLGTFGNAGRNILTGPGTFNVDLSPHKNFRFTERWNLQYRAEFFSAFNHTNLNNPGTTVSSGSFGRIHRGGVAAHSPRWH